MRRPAVLRPAIVAVLSIVATFGFRGVFDGYGFLIAAVIGGFGAALISYIGRLLGLRTGEAVLASLVGFAVLGGPAVGGLPMPTAYQEFGSGLINGWSRVLSSIPPADLIAEYRVLPYSVAWLGALVGCELLRSRRLGGFAVIGPLIGVAITTLMSLEHRSMALVEGAVLAAGGLLLGWLHRRQRIADDAAGDLAVPTSRAALVWTGVMVAVVVIGAALVGPRLPTATANERFDLRDLQVPPFDPLAEPTPLSQIKAGQQESNADRVVFRVTSQSTIDRVNLAVLDAYNGEFWLVADESADDPAQFRPIDLSMPAPPDGSLSQWSTVSATIEVVDLDHLSGGEFAPVWLPVPGWPLEIRSDTDLDLRANLATGTVAAAPDGVRSGTSYEVEAALPPRVEDLDLNQATVTLREPFDLAVPQLRSFTADVVEGADVGWEQVEAVRARFVELGAYDSRAGSPAARPGHHLGRLAEFVNDPDALIGFEEQYAATAALMLRSGGLPARVVVGFEIPDDEIAQRVEGNTVSFLADDLSAWIEVRFDGVGWLPFDVTPPRDRLPDDSPVGRTEREVAVPNPPPDPPPPVEPPLRGDDPETEPTVPPTSAPNDDGSTMNWRPIAIGSAAALPVVAVVVGVATILVMKRRRRARRRADHDAGRQIAGAWYEVIDRLVEQGRDAPKSATNHELARGVHDAGLVDETDGDLLIRLADRVDAAAFGDEHPDQEVVDRAWASADAVGRSVSGSLSRPRRWLARLNPRPLLQGDPLLDSRGDDE